MAAGLQQVTDQGYDGAFAICARNTNNRRADFGHKEINIRSRSDARGMCLPHQCMMQG
jgi:hypothetical protein